MSKYTNTIGGDLYDCTLNGCGERAKGQKKEDVDVRASCFSHRAHISPKQARGYASKKRSTYGIRPPDLTYNTSSRVWLGLAASGVDKGDAKGDGEVRIRDELTE